MTQLPFFDTPGAAARRRHLVLTVLSGAALAVVAAVALVQLRDRGQLAAGLWQPFTQPAVLRFLAAGVLATIQVTVVSAALAAPLALVLALCRASRSGPVRWVSTAYVETFRSIPVLLLLYAFLVGAPRVGLNISVFWQLALAIALTNIAVVAEIFRAGIAAVPRGQTEAAAALGMRPGSTLRHVVLPQAIRTMSPALVAQLVRLMKESTLGYAVSYVELLHQGRVLAENTGALLPTYVVIAIFFIVLNEALSRLAERLRRRPSRGPTGAGTTATTTRDPGGVASLA